MTRNKQTIEVVTVSEERRRRWSAEEKRRWYARHTSQA